MKNSVAIVTGASQGIGRSTAIRLASDFSALVLAARNAKALEEIAAAVKKAGAEPLPLAVDLSQVDASEVVVKTALERFGRIDALLNIAGAVPQINLFEMTDEQWKAGMELKLHGARRLTIQAWDALKQAHGSVVFMSGSDSLDPKPAFAAVAATNAAITALAKAFAPDFAIDVILEAASVTLGDGSLPGRAATGLTGTSWQQATGLPASAGNAARRHS